MAPPQDLLQADDVELHAAEDLAERSQSKPRTAEEKRVEGEQANAQRGFLRNRSRIVAMRTSGAADGSNRPARTSSRAAWISAWKLATSHASGRSVRYRRPRRDGVAGRDERGREADILATERGGPAASTLSRMSGEAAPDGGGLPGRVREAFRRARRAGFELSSEPEVGRLLAVLAAGVPAGGRILELGTGLGVGLAWLVHGLGDRADVEVWSVEIDPERAALVLEGGWPGYVRVEVADGQRLVRAHPATFDLVFADAQGGKWEGLEQTVAALRPGGHLLVDDMTPARWIDETHRTKTEEVRASLLGSPDLVAVELAWATGLVLCARRHRPRRTPAG